MQKSINILLDKISSVLGDNKYSIIIYGSTVLDDFQLGWSDIDILCLTENIISESQANQLVNLRNKLQEEYLDNNYFRLFEGVFIHREAFINHEESRVIYWGTSGQRIINEYELDCFSRMIIKDSGKLLCGKDFSNLIVYPNSTEIKNAIEQHYLMIREYGNSGKFLLDIARCIYTLRFNKIISKTKAGEWALKENLCPDAEVLIKVLEIRKNPLSMNYDTNLEHWLKNLNQYVQRFADVLEIELYSL